MRFEQIEDLLTPDLSLALPQFGSLRFARHSDAMRAAWDGFRLMNNSFIPPSCNIRSCTQTWAKSELELNNSSTNTNGDSLRAVACTKFLQDVPKVRLNRFF